MEEAIREKQAPTGALGIQISMITLENPHIPMHYHDTLEILYCLNGSIKVHVDGQSIELKHKQLIVFDANEVHALHSDSSLYMFICIQIDKKQLATYIPDLELYRIVCRPIPVDHPSYDHYLQLCRDILKLVSYNKNEATTDKLRLNGAILSIFADLIDYFSIFTPSQTSSPEKKPNDTIREIITYVNEHFTEDITLEDMASMCGFSKEYFCRYFKQHMGLTFLRYLGEVRIAYAGKLLTTSDIAISDAMLKCGFTNQTIFNRLFKEIYGMTPREAKKTNSLTVS